jgi:hypothetical protein
MALSQQDKDFIALSIQGTNARIADMHDNFSDKLNFIKEQTLKTNGRVGELETWKEDQRIFCGEVQSAKKERASAKERRQKIINLSLYCVMTAIAVFGVVAKFQMSDTYASKEYEMQALKEFQDQARILQNAVINTQEDFDNLRDSLNNHYYFWKAMNATRDSNQENEPIQR